MSCDLGAMVNTSKGKELGAYIDPDLEVAPTRSGSLDGLTFAVKDLFDVSTHGHGV